MTKKYGRTKIKFIYTGSGPEDLEEQVNKYLSEEYTADNYVVELREEGEYGMLIISKVRIVY